MSFNKGIQIAAIGFVLFFENVHGFSHTRTTFCRANGSVPLSSHTNSGTDVGNDQHQQASPASPSRSPMMDRRNLLQQSTAATTTLLLLPLLSSPAHAAFTPGGTLVDFEVGPQVGNPQASPSRKPDNSNVLFAQDHYFKFGTAAPWIPEGGTDFPKTMPFVVSQQRYDALKKYGERVNAGVAAFGGMFNEEDQTKTAYTDLPDADAPVYALRAMGLLANNFMASENTGTTNELLLARWYINEVYLRVNDVRTATSEKEARRCWEAGKLAINSYMGMMNRVVTSKVGDKFVLLPV